MQTAFNVGFQMANSEVCHFPQFEFFESWGEGVWERDFHSCYIIRESTLLQSLFDIEGGTAWLIFLLEIGCDAKRFGQEDEQQNASARYVHRFEPFPCSPRLGREEVALSARRQCFWLRDAVRVPRSRQRLHSWHTTVASFRLTVVRVRRFKASKLLSLPIFSSADTAILRERCAYFFKILNLVSCS